MNGEMQIEVWKMRDELWVQKKMEIGVHGDATGDRSERGRQMYVEFQTKKTEVGEVMTLIGSVDDI